MGNALSSFDQFSEEILAKTPLFVIGSGFSIGAGIPGMPSLASWLTKNVVSSQEDATAWHQIVQQLTSGVGLEAALQNAGAIRPALRDSIVQWTWRFIRSHELDALIRSAKGEDVTGLACLLQRFSNSTNTRVDILTTNYDQVIEWSCGVANWSVWDGFDGNALAKPILHDKWLVQSHGGSKSRKEASASPFRHVRLFKVHGSVSWFKRDGSLIKLPGLHESDLSTIINEGFQPTLVTPGTDKYLEGYQDPYGSIFAEAHRAIDAARALIFIGFGFNDFHVLGPLEGKLTDRSIPKLIITKHFSKPLIDRIETKKIRSFTAVEDGGPLRSSIKSDLIDSSATEAGRWTLAGMLAGAWGLEEQT